MKCPFCGGTESRVKDSRDIGDAIHRRRECEQCKGRFSTYERVEKFHLLVIKQDQRREAFDRQKTRKFADDTVHAFVQPVVFIPRRAFA